LVKMLSRCGSVLAQSWKIVAGAWDFERINRRYARHLKILGKRLGGALRNDATAKALLRWAGTEREAWLEAVTNDPLLLGRILPSDYLGNRRGGGWKCSEDASRSRACGTHVQTRIALCKTLLHMQQEFVVGAGGN
jgi:hypothetical protein